MDTAKRGLVDSRVAFHTKKFHLSNFSPLCGQIQKKSVHKTTLILDFSRLFFTLSLEPLYRHTIFGIF